MPTCMHSCAAKLRLMQCPWQDACCMVASRPYLSPSAGLRQTYALSTAETLSGPVNTKPDVSTSTHHCINQALAIRPQYVRLALTARSWATPHPTAVLDGWNISSSKAWHTWHMLRAGPHSNCTPMHCTHREPQHSQHIGAAALRTSHTSRSIQLLSVKHMHAWRHAHLYPCCRTCTPTQMAATLITI
jgi:hypothetical protein